jgi:hypothetical protein
MCWSPAADGGPNLTSASSAWPAGEPVCLQAIGFWRRHGGLSHSSSPTVQSASMIPGLHFTGLPRPLESWQQRPRENSAAGTPMMIRFWGLRWPLKLPSLSRKTAIYSSWRSRSGLRLFGRGHFWPGFSVRSSLFLVALRTRNFTLPPGRKIRASSRRLLRNFWWRTSLDHRTSRNILARPNRRQRSTLP